MGWSLGYDSEWKRDIGYGVPAYCDHPDCNAEIDRGLAHVCGGEPYGGGRGCGLYFCGNHLLLPLRRPQLCERCERRRKPFVAKPDSPRLDRLEADARKLGAMARREPRGGGKDESKQGGQVRTVRNFFARLFGRAPARPEPTATHPDPLDWLVETMNDPAVAPELRIAAAQAVMPYGDRLPKRIPVPRSRPVAAVSVPRRAPVAAAAPTHSIRSSTTDDGMSMLPAAMLLSSRDETPAPANCSRWDALVGGGGSFDGGGASGNWDSGSSSSSDSYSSSDSGSSSSSSD